MGKNRSFNHFHGLCSITKAQVILEQIELSVNRPLIEFLCEPNCCDVLRAKGGTQHLFFFLERNWNKNRSSSRPCHVFLCQIQVGPSPVAFFSVPGFHSSVAIGQGGPIRKDSPLVIGDPVLLLEGFCHHLNNPNAISHFIQCEKFFESRTKQIFFFKAESTTLPCVLPLWRFWSAPQGSCLWIWRPGTLPPSGPRSGS